MNTCTPQMQSYGNPPDAIVSELAPGLELGAGGGGGGAASGEADVPEDCKMQ
jgi:hypothetical protein